MRIFQVLESSTNLALPDNQTWRRNLHEPLVDLGHEVLLLDPAVGRSAMLLDDAGRRRAFSEQLVDVFRREHSTHPFDLAFMYLMDGMIDAAAIDEIRLSGVPTCNFSCNNVHQFDLVDGISPHFDYNLHAERDVRDKFLAIGANPVWWPMAANPKYFAPSDVPRDVAVSFVGANYALRTRYILHLLENGVDVHAYGPGWQRRGARRWRSLARRYLLLSRAAVAIGVGPHYRSSAALAEHDLHRYLRARYPRNVHDPISDHELILLYSRSRISLGFLEVYDGHDPSRTVKHHMHLREFEAPMSGALYCTGYSDELAEMFEPDGEVVVYRNQHELLEKVRYYLAHPAEGEKVRLAGRRRALRDHTYHQRFQQLFGELGLERRGTRA